MIERRNLLKHGLAGIVIGAVLMGTGLQPLEAGEVKDRVLGSDDAPVTMIEYASLTCPHCASFHREVLPIIKERFIDTGQVKFVYRDFPLDQVALKASIVAHCAGDDRFFNFLDALFQTQQSWAYAQDPEVALRQIAKVGGLPDADVDACLADPAMEEGVLKSRLEGANTYEVRSTPTLIINDEVISGNQSVDDFVAVIEKNL